MTCTTPSRELHQALHDISTRLAALESQRARKPPVAPVASPPPAVDAFAAHMHVLALSHGFTDTIFVRTPANYYAQPLSARRALLGAPSPHHLTKSIVLHNTRYVPSPPGAHALRSQYICAIFPYTTRMDTDLLRMEVRRHLADVEGTPPPKGAFNFRLADDCIGVTGYEPNAVTPLGLRTDMPVVLAAQVSALDPPVFWMGGGEVCLKWRVRRDEFELAFRPFVLNFAVDGTE